MLILNDTSNTIFNLDNINTIYVDYSRANINYLIGTVLNTDIKIAKFSNINDANDAVYKIFNAYNRNLKAITIKDKVNKDDAN